MSDLRWEAPGPGEWYFEAAHFPRPVSRLFAELFGRMTVGWASGAARYGEGNPACRMATVHDYFYFSFDPAPPNDEDELATAKAERRWRDEATLWFEQERPAVIDANRALQAVDLRALDDAGLRDHIARAIQHFELVSPLHFEHRGRSLVIELLAEQAESVGVSRETVASLLVGSSPASRRPAELSAAIAEALREEGIDADDIATLDDVRFAVEADAILDAYLEDYGCRLVDSYEVATPTLGERPDVILRGVLAALEGRRPHRSDVPPTPEGIDLELLEDARVGYSMRDDDNGICFLWPLGLVRLAVLEAGRRWVAAGTLHDAHDAFEQAPAELLARFDDSGPNADELRSRAQARRDAARLTAPSVLGGPPREQTTADSTGPDVPTTELRGTGIGTGCHQGRARVVAGDTDALTFIQPGDILISVMTGPAYNAIFPFLGAVAVEEGNLHCHTAILARELGIPAVIGVRGLLAAIGDSDHVEIDAVAGTVRIL